MSSEIDAALAQLAAGKVVAAATESFFGFWRTSGTRWPWRRCSRSSRAAQTRAYRPFCQRALPGPRSSQDRSPPWPRPSLIVGAFR